MSPMKIIIKNKIAYHNYEILEKIEAGMVLLGSEIKSIRNGQVSIKEGHARIRNEQAWLTNVHIAPYKQGSPADYNPLRERKLLLNKSEIKKLIGKLQEKGLSLIPLTLYIKKNNAKIELGLAKGLKKYDKRAKLKTKEFKRIQQRKLKPRN